MKNFLFWNLKKEIKGYGFTYSFKKFFLTVLLVMATAVGACYFYDIKWEYIAIVAVVCALCVPVVVLSQFKFLYKQRRFADVDTYLHQMVVSFKRDGKISLALKDTYKIANGELKKVIGRAIEELESSTKESLFEDALGVIEEEYPSDRIKNLHKFLISVEHRGGAYETSLDVLSMDFDRYVANTYKRQMDVKKHKINTAIGLIISFCLATCTVLIAKILQASAGLEMDITGDPTYQIVSIAFMIICVVYYTGVVARNTGEWLKPERTDEMIIKDYNMAFNTDIRSLRLKSIPLYVIMLGLSIGCFIPGQLIFKVIGVVLIIFTLIMLIIPDLDKGTAKKRVQEDVYNAFADWLRDVSINLQASPLQVAIEKTLDDCPVVLANSLENFVEDINRDPSDVVPYHEFLSEFGIIDISSTIQTLYAYSELAEDEIDAAVSTLIEKNYAVVDKHDEIKAKDSLSTMTFSEYTPVMFVAVKIATDMLLIISNYL